MNLRLEDWPQRLAAFIEQRRRMPFAWGVHDCCQFARAGVAAMRGTDPAAGLRSRRYSTAQGAAAQLRRLGGTEAIPAACGLEEIPVAFAGRGDVVLFDQDGGPLSVVRGPALGLCLGEHTAFPGPSGLVFVPALSCRRTWRV